MRQLITGGKPLTDAAARPAIAALIAVCAAVTVAIGIIFAGQHAPGSADRWIDGEISYRLGTTGVGNFANLGSPHWVAVITAIAVAAFLLGRRLRAAALVLICVPLAPAITDYVLKPLFGRELGGNLTYPSGHTTAAATLALIGVVLLTGPARPRLPPAVRWLACLVLLGVLPLVAAGLVVIRFHYFTDTIGGAGVAATVVGTTALTLDAAAGWLTARLRPVPGAAGGISARADELPRA